MEIHILRFITAVKKLQNQQFCYLFILGISLQSLSPAVANINNIKFYNLNEEYNISIRGTNQICPDVNGFIWFSSKMGIIRFTQGDVKTYPLPNETSNIIAVGMVSRNENLYAYSNNGQVFRYNAVQDHFELYINLGKYINNPFVSVNKIILDDSDKLWIASSSGLFSYSDSLGLKSHSSNRQIQYLKWKDNFSFFCFIDGKILIYDLNSSKIENYFSYSKELNISVSSIFFDKTTSDLWLGTLGSGLYKISDGPDGLGMKRVKKIPNQPILAIEQLPDNSLLLGIDGQGLWNMNLDGKIKSVYKENSDDQYSLKGNGVYDIYCAPNGWVWVCTYSEGVSYFKLVDSDIRNVSHIINNANSLINNDVNAVLEDANGDIWFATNNGISCWNPNNNNWKTYFHNNQEHAQVFLSLCEDNKGNIWAGTYSSGVYVISKELDKEIAHYSQDNFSDTFNNNFVFDIILDSSGDVWIGGVRGDLIRYNSDSQQFNSYSDVTVKVLWDYSKEKLLIGSPYGLLLFDKIDGTSQLLLDGFIIYDIQVQDNLIWTATSGDGIVIYDLSSKIAKHINIDSGLPSNFVNSLAYSSGFIWAGTEQGLSKIKINDLAITTFQSSETLNNTSFNQDAQYALKNGKLLFGTNKGGLIIDPQQLEPTIEKGNIFIQDFRVSGRSIREIKSLVPQIPLDRIQQITLTYLQNNISLELLPKGASSTGYKFSWKLEGLDEQWSKPDNIGVLSYSNIPSGEYSLKIRMYDNALTKVIEERSITMLFVPPIWERWWFKMSISLFILAMIMFFFIYYINRLKKRHSDEKIRFFVNTAHDIRTSLTLINGPIEELNKELGLSDKGQHYLQLATNQARRLSNVVTQLMDFQKVDIGKQKFTLTKVNIAKFIESRVEMFETYASNKNIKINYKAKDDTCVAVVDEMVIEKIVDNLLSNAIKFSFDDSSINVNFKCVSNKWILEVQDFGIGIPKMAQKQLFKEFYRGENAINSKIVGSGIGLLLVKNYVTILGGKITCISEDKKGSIFQVTVPLMHKKVNPSPIVSNVTKLKPYLDEYQPTIQFKKEDNSTKQSLKVLIVEDNEYLREFLGTALAEDFQILTAENGEKAWPLLEKHSPDLVVSDIMMPKMDGFELCQRIKASYETSHIAVILLTSLTGKAQQLKGLGLGADDYLTKPFDVTILLQRIKSIIQNREIIRRKALKIIKHDKDQKALFENKLNDEFLKKVIEEIRSNIDNPLYSKEDFASALNISASLLYKKVKALTDQSPTDLIKSIRLEHAVELLSTKKYTVTEVSEMCGFSSIGYFSTVFKKHYGKSPSQID